jgi:hypothetical protein
LTKVKYRSKFEAKIADQLRSLRVSFSYESETLKYTSPVRSGTCLDCKGTNVVKKRTYTPDFIITTKKDGRVYVEVKGRLTSRDRTKMLDVIKAHPGIRLVMILQRDNKIKGSFKYSDWLKKHSIEFYIGEVKSLCIQLGQK